MRFFISLLFTAFLAVIIFHSSERFKAINAMSWDKGGYYVYLPATIIYHDLEKLSFRDEMASKYDLHGFSDPNDVYKSPVTGHRFTKYPLGVAVAELPFFLTAHLYTKLTGIAPADGFSLPYSMSRDLSNIFYAILGLFDGEIRITEKDTSKGLEKVLRVRKLYNQRYIESELVVTRQKIEE